MLCVACSERHMAHVAIKMNEEDNLILPVCHDVWVSNKDSVVPVKTIGKYRLSPEDILNS